jgi:hypothetical protein
MIDADLLKQLGWSDDLIAAVSRVAEPMRNYPLADVPLPGASVLSISSSAVFADAVVNNTSREFKVAEPPSGE